MPSNKWDDEEQPNVAEEASAKADDFFNELLRERGIDPDEFMERMEGQSPPIDQAIAVCGALAAVVSVIENLPDSQLSKKTIIKDVIFPILSSIYIEALHHEDREANEDMIPHSSEMILPANREWWDEVFNKEHAAFHMNLIKRQLKKED